MNKANEELTACIDALQTIVSCSLHQKRLIDDVLTLSKLDAKLLLIIPTRVRPEIVLSEAMKMFEVECKQMNIVFSLKRDDSLRGFDWVMMDPSRMVQVLINLVTNAIKFTKDCDRREIAITIGASWTRPPAVWQNVDFGEDCPARDDVCDKPEWGSGPKGYLWFRIIDTGCGMTIDEQRKLFSRFTQSTPRKSLEPVLVVIRKQFG